MRPDPLGGETLPAPKVQTVDYRNNARLMRDGVSFHWWELQETSLHNHNHYEFFIITHDRITHVLNGEAKELGTGTLHFIRPRDCHQFLPAPGGRSIHINLSFTEEKFASLCAALGLASEALLGEGAERCLTLNKEELGFFVNRARQLNYLLHAGEDPRALGALIVCEMLAQAIALLYKKHSLFFDGAPEWLNNLLQKIHSPEHVACSAREVYEMAGYSPPVVIRCFKRYTGRTVREYLTSTKIDCARDLFANTSMTTLEVAGKLGFESLGYFNKLFRQYTGKSPRDFRAG
ncbi:MAG TPA: AraC family transcriptional regulator [Clostridia bacterium]|nr:AraC family transcriptional regulator [Clostridia bacterium]